MSVINQVRLPVKVYRWDDDNAPKYDKSPNCLATIFKACLVTGYGSKAGAGWSMPFEDMQAGVKVLRPPLSAEQDFYLRLSNDTGTQLKATVYLNMTAADTGEIKLQSDTDFYYAKANISGKWLMLATDRQVWFLTEQHYQPEKINKAGTFFVCGDTAKNEITGEKAIILHHSGGTFNQSYALYDSPLSLTPNMSAGMSKIPIKVYLASDNTVSSLNAISTFDGNNNLTNDLYTSPLFFIINKKIYQIPGVYASSKGGVDNNFTMLNTNFDGEDKTLITFSMSSSDSYYSNFLFDTLRIAY